MTPDEALKFFTERKTAYQIAFGGAHGQAVLDDLTPFCRARETCVVPGDRDRTFVLEGRREVFLRIEDYLNLTPEELVQLRTRPATGATSHDRTDELP
jgi:hypothetical protein